MLRNRAWVAAMVFALALNSSVSANKGTIRFVGVLVESGCEIIPTVKGFHSSCYQDGDYQNRAYEALKSGDQVVLPSNVANVRLQPIVGHPNLGHLVISYH
ncbi:type 1 fimbrial protein [Hafnia paralvei]|uniref:type 1 fimbrial protein n=1 Tax=Hafnia paralvei TaxID=546367 RepID=UPI001033D928|nr:type 1 fimbrial protein [Hafnia paralvei]TBM19035.1 type 1 fimbrial protein [Hafnia paralvei]UBM39127.1 type 1 fimbrial protein [Hafnia paralvei]